MKFKSKAEFEQLCQQEWQTLWILVDDLSESKSCKRKSGRDGRSVKDHLAHLYCWHRLLLNWKKSGEKGVAVHMPAKGFNWRQTPDLNRQLFEEFKDESLSTVTRKLKLSHGRVMKWVKQMADSEFQKSGRFDWTGKYAVSSYIAPNTISHYRWAQKKIKKA